MEENKALIEKWVKQLMKKYDLYYLEPFSLVKADTASYDPRTELTYRLTYDELQQQADDEADHTQHLHIRPSFVRMSLRYCPV